jgi:acyl carrier protein
MHVLTSGNDLEADQQAVTPTESAISDIVVECIGHPVGAEVDFFSFGLSSLAVFRIFSRVEARFQISIDAEAALQTATIREISDLVDQTLRQNAGGLADRGPLTW